MYEKFSRIPKSFGKNMEQLQVIQSKIYEMRGQKVMLDRNLAEMYGVEVRALNQAVKRNIDRFPSDFMFQLNEEEWANLKSQFVISSWGGVWPSCKRNGKRKKSHGIPSGLSNRKHKSFISLFSVTLSYLLYMKKLE